jgi:hypothetical protein
MFTPTRLTRLTDTADLTHFNAIILPDGVGYEGVLGKSGVANLKAWVERGGVLIGVGGGGRWFIGKDAGLSSATRVGDDDLETKDDGKEERNTRRPKAPIELPGTIFLAQIDPTHFLGYGYPGGQIAVPLSGGTFLKPSKTGANVVTFGKGAHKLSGFVWPENTEPLLTDTAYVIDEPIGRGHALLYLEDPTFRALWPGLRRLFLSGILFGTAGSAVAAAPR